MVSMASFSIPGWGTGTPMWGKGLLTECLVLTHRRAHDKALLGDGGRVEGLRYGFNAAPPPGSPSFRGKHDASRVRLSDVRHARCDPRAALPQREAKHPGAERRGASPPRRAPPAVGASSRAGGAPGRPGHWA